MALGNPRGQDAAAKERQVALGATVPYAEVRVRVQVQAVVRVKVEIFE